MRSSRLPVPSSVALAEGLLVTRVSARRAYDRERRQFGDQEIDPETGLPIHTVEGYDIAAMKAPPIVTKTGFTFKDPAERKIFVISAEEPVIPSNQVNGFSGVAQFDDLMITPWLDDKRCEGLRHDDEGEKLRCGCRILLSFRAYGMSPFRG